MKRVLVYRTGHLGDTICAIPAFRLIRQNFPDASMSLLCDKPSKGKVAVADVIASLELFDEVLSYESGQGYLTWWRALAQLRMAKPDIVVLLSQARESDASVIRKRFVARLAGAHQVFSSLDGSRAYASDNEPTRLVKMLNSIGLNGEKPPYSIPLNVIARESIAWKLRNAGVNPTEPFLVLCSGGKSKAQRWPDERYVALMDDIARNYRLPVLVIGSDAETARIQGKSKSLKSITGGTSIDELFELFRCATAYIGNDTGPMHVAASVGCPVAVVMSGRNLPGAWDPDVELRLVMRHRTSCENCFLEDCVLERHRCMTSISVESVARKLGPFIGKCLVSR